MSLTRIAAPAAEPVTVAEAKEFLRIEHDAEDTLIGKLIKAARAVAEEHLRRSLVTQSWRFAVEPVTAAYLPLPRGPVQSVTQVALVALDGTQTVLSASRYRLTAGKDTLRLEDSPDHARIEMEYVAGYGDEASDVPDAIRQGLLMHVAALYEQRGGASLPEGVLALFAPYREMRV